ncbi:ATPase family AAA domain-containing protein 2-like, partial [Sitophilus oryzae]
MSLQNQNQNHSGQRSAKRTKYSKDPIDFCKVGGLAHHLATLREVIIIPLLHSNVFAHFNMKAPRGVLFYGPPGTGKTLIAAALATEINREGIGKVAFFERKGADVLDKWVGGSEKNLRDLFDKATKSRPSIIFFDELDGLAPIRDKQTDQIHSSVVATLLALMDGLDNKPGLIVIGATNRIEAIDPALRRPGRFDKEMYFPLPGVEARREILE